MSVSLSGPTSLSLGQLATYSAYVNASGSAATTGTVTFYDGALVMGTGGRIHARLGGLTKDNISVHDGQR